MRPHCVKYVVLLVFVCLCTLYHLVSSDVPKMWLCVICMCIGGTHNDVH